MHGLMFLLDIPSDLGRLYFLFKLRQSQNEFSITLKLMKNKTNNMLFPEATRAFEPISYRGVLPSTLIHATVYVFYTICWIY
jgi:hypothetical protein